MQRKVTVCQQTLSSQDPEKKKISTYNVLDDAEKEIYAVKGICVVVDSLGDVKDTLRIYKFIYF